MKLISALCVPVLAVGLGAVVAAPASAHTPAFSASCDGVRVAATAYDAGVANRWSVTINGVTQSGTFGASFDQTFAVPQDGATSTWSAYVEAADGSYHGEDAGQVGPCGTPPDACADLPGAQPEGTSCTPPPDVERADGHRLADCAVRFAGTRYGAGVLTYDEVYTDTHVFDEATNVWNLVTDVEPTIANVVFTPWTKAQQIRHGCIDRGVAPSNAQQGQPTQGVSDGALQPVTAPSPTAAVPTAVDAGLAPAAASARDGSRAPALLVLLAGGVLLAAGAFRLRRS